MRHWRRGGKIFLYLIVLHDLHDANRERLSSAELRDATQLPEGFTSGQLTIVRYENCSLNAEVLNNSKSFLIY